MQLIVKENRKKFYQRAMMRGMNEIIEELKN